jgi:GT2 family glycosyltransferase
MDLQVVVVDNNSQDGTDRRDPPQIPPNVNLILNNENLGFSRAVNQGLKDVGCADIISLLNPDTIILDNAMQTIISSLWKIPRRRGSVFPKYLNRDGTLQYQCRRGEARPWEVVSYFLGLGPPFSE